MKPCRMLVLALWAAGAAVAEPDAFQSTCLPLAGDDDGPPRLRLAPIVRLRGNEGVLGPTLAQVRSLFARGLPEVAAQATPAERLVNANLAAAAEATAGRLAAAADQFAQCAQGARELADPEAQATCTANRAVVLAVQGRISEARALFEASSARYREAAAARSGALQRHMAALGVQRTALNLGQLMLSLGQREAALNHFETAVALVDELRLKQECAGAAAQDLARLHRMLGRTQQADALLRRYRLRPGQKDDDPQQGVGSVVELDRLTVGAVGVAVAPAAPASAPGISLLQPLAVAGEAGLRQLMAQADADHKAGRRQAARDGYARAALRAAVAGRAGDEIAARGALAFAYAYAGQRGPAIFHAKAAVLLAQRQQQDPGMLRAERRTLLRERMRLHHALAQWLLDERRLAEAERVMQLVKDEEARQFTDPAAARKIASLPESAAESRAAKAFLAGVAELRQLEQGRAGAAAASPMAVQIQGEDLKTLEQRRLEAAQAVIDFLASDAGPGSTQMEQTLDLLTASGRAVMQDLLGGTPQRLKLLLQHLAEDAARFNEAPPAPADRAALAEALRRADEFHARVQPMLQRVGRKPAGAGAEAVMSAMSRMTDPKAAQNQPFLLLNESFMDAIGGLGDWRSKLGRLHAMLRGTSVATIDTLEKSAIAFNRGYDNMPVGSVREYRAELRRIFDALRRAPDAGTSTTDFSRMMSTLPRSPEQNRRVASLLELPEREAAWRTEQARQAAEQRLAQAEAAQAAPLQAEAASAAAADDEMAAWLARRMPAAAAMYLLPSESRTDVLLVTARGRQAWRIDMPAVDLGARVARLQAALRRPAGDPQAAAQDLYRLLWAPADGALSAAGVRVVAVAAFGRLRFVPLAALHDGRQWLVERYALASLPAARPPGEPARASPPHWSIAAFGASRGGAGLPPLPAVPRELESVVQAGGTPRGRAWLDREFTAAALRGALDGSHQVVHVAGHFRFEPGDAAGSFLLLGDGKRLSLKDLAGADYRFDRTELVTLSACQTGLSEDDAFGQEVDGLGALLMAQGAPAVLASLWQVADDSTARLMGTLYRLRESPGGPLPLALALQQAQVAMIRRSADAPVALARGATRPGLAAPASTVHPYHWAPFVLMGQWR